MSGVIFFCGFILVLTFLFELFDDDDYTLDSWIIGMKFTATIVVLVIGIWGLVNHEMDANPLFTHIDHSKTRTIKENGAVTDLYLTIDGKEYHFELKEE